jgi:hypothetical protein
MMSAACQSCRVPAAILLAWSRATIFCGHAPALHTKNKIAAKSFHDRSITHMISHQNQSRKLVKSVPTIAVSITFSALALSVGLFYTLSTQWAVKPALIVILATFPMGAFAYVFFTNGRG